jgi:acetyltransferase-like isoleucine patch superfamily enzyme
MGKILNNFYYTDSLKGTIKSIFYDGICAIFLNSGSGLVTSLVKGFIGHFFIKSIYPLYIGKRTKFVNTYNIVLGKNVRIADDVSIIAYGKVFIGDNVIIGEKTTLIANSKLIIGSDCVITRNCYIAQLGGPILIDDNVLVGDFTRIHSINHSYLQRNIPLSMQKHISNKIHIGESVWIGSVSNK